jgi:hypothetical protein
MRHWTCFCKFMRPHRQHEHEREPIIYHDSSRRSNQRHRRGRQTDRDVQQVEPVYPRWGRWRLVSCAACLVILLAGAPSTMATVSAVGAPPAPPGPRQMWVREGMSCKPATSVVGDTTRSGTESLTAQALAPGECLPLKALISRAEAAGHCAFAVSGVALHRSEEAKGTELPRHSLRSCTQARASAKSLSASAQSPPRARSRRHVHVYDMCICSCICSCTTDAYGCASAWCTPCTAAGFLKWKISGRSPSQLLTPRHKPTSPHAHKPTRPQAHTRHAPHTPQAYTPRPTCRASHALPPLPLLVSSRS